MMIPEGPFAVRVISYAIAGFGIALQVSSPNDLIIHLFSPALSASDHHDIMTYDFCFAIQNAGANGFVGSLHENTERKLGFLHGCYGTHASICHRAFHVVAIPSLVFRWAINVNVQVMT